MRRLALAFLLTLALPCFAAKLERWVYVSSNLQVDANADQVIALLQRAKACGYTHLLIKDSKFARIPTLPKRYFQNVERVRLAAKAAGIELVPAVFSVGYSNDLLWNDPNLAEGLPVKDALFVVKDYIASHVPDPLVILKDGGLLNRKAWGFIDAGMISENGSLRSDTTEQNARFSQKVKVQPFRQYHVSVRIKTERFQDSLAEIKAIGAFGQQLTYTYLHEQQTQDWTVHHVTFNSLQNTEVQLYFGVWGGHDGTIWWRDPAIEECGLVNLLRRPGAPLVVRTEDGRLLREGVDYEPVANPRTGTVPYAGEYELWHEPPNIHVTDLPDGTRLRVSFYHPHVVYYDQVCACTSEPAFTALLKRQAGEVHGLWAAGSYMMSHDEWRVMNWCDACQRRKLTPGQIVADSARTCTQLLHSASPGARVFVWSDMFDPFHNARSNFYLVNGDLKGSWEGLGTEVIIVNWNQGETDGVRFFANRGNRQLMAGYYDAPVEKTRKWLQEATLEKGVMGVMYTTWRNNYGQLEAFSKMLDDEGW